MLRRKNTLWFVYLAWVLCAIYFGNDAHAFQSQGAYPLGKYIAWIAFVTFTAYTYHASRHENLFKTIGIMKGYYWGRQIGIDLYLGLLIFMPIIYLTEGSVWVALIWLLPVLAFANLATLLYIAVNYDSILKLLLN